MALIRKNELKRMDLQQLMEKRIELRKEMMKIGAQLSTKTTPENPGRIRAVKKTIARMNTLLAQAKVKKQAHQEPQQKKTTKEVKKAKV